jgi:hypothetical protein
MYDQSINPNSLYQTLRRSDFHQVFDLRDDKLRSEIISRSVSIGAVGCWNVSPLKVSQLRGKDVYSLPDFHNELIVRKINNNIRHFTNTRNPARTSIVSNLSRIISEAVPYRLYRLDVKSFFESFAIGHVLKTIDDINILSLATKRLLRDLFKHFVESGGSGIPRGLAISSTLSEIMMADFDIKMKNMEGVFFYARYVDDIIIVTSGTESQSQFIKSIQDYLPDGLKFSRKKQGISTVPRATKASAYHYCFEYLGYKFNINDPKSASEFRKVTLGISDGKLNKIKTRLICALRDFCKTGESAILVERIRFLCGNFSLNDRDRGRKRLAGIFYNYHLIDAANPNCGLRELDLFLQKAIISGSGNVFSVFKKKSTSLERRRLARFSFYRGFKDKVFINYTGSKLKLIQECWKYA